MKKVGLTLVLLFLFLGSICGQFFSGYKAYNEDRKERHLPALESHYEYLTSGHFVSSVAENMESEFLQMGLFVLLTVFFYQIGSSESKKLPECKTSEDLFQEKNENNFNEQKRKQHPFLWRLYENSLTTALLFLFIIAFLFHSYGSWQVINEQKSYLNEPLISYKEVFLEPDFWFESFQNWQSEFFSIAVLIVLSIFLRQYRSPQSKKMNDSVLTTGE